MKYWFYKHKIHTNFLGRNVLRIEVNMVINGKCTGTSQWSLMAVITVSIDWDQWDSFHMSAVSASASAITVICKLHYVDWLQSRFPITWWLYFRKHSNTFAFSIISQHLTQVAEILSSREWVPIYLTWLITWLLMTWWCTKLGHQQPWYWLYYSRIFWYQHHIDVWAHGGLN